MRRLRLILAALFGVAAAAGLAHAADDYFYGNHAPPRAVIIGIDLSGSNPLIADPAFAEKVAARIHPIIESLSPRSRVTLRSFGSYDTSANALLTLDIVIAPKSARSEDIARLVSSVVGGVPKLVRQGKLHVQNSTNIVAFLDNMAATTDCRALPATVILASDGIEDSKIANLSRRNATLPPPPATIFAGCDELQILGLAQGLNDPRATESLRHEWSVWANAAGFKHFIGLNDW